MNARKTDQQHGAQHNRRSSQQRRAAFTLIELLMVLAIIGILISILVPVIASAFRKGQEAAEFTEITNLAGALQKFKDRYGVYPPSQIILREDGDYYVGGNPIVAPSPQDTAVFDEALSVQYLRRIWPQLVIHTRTNLTPYPVTPTEIGDISGDGTVNANDFYDWNGDGSLGNPAQVHYLQGDECLVFFLGGLPTGQVANTKNPAGCTGFSKAPQWPTQRTGIAPGAGRDGPFHELSSARLVDRDNDGFWELVPFRKPSVSGPYAYFSAYDGAGYRPDDLNLTTEPAPNGGTMPTTKFQVLWPISATYPTATRRGSGTPADPYYVESPGPNPYTLGSAYPSTAPPIPAGFIVRYHKPDGFQIISPGPAVGYGHGGEFPLDDQLDNRDDNDNLTNFSSGPMQDAKL